MPPSFFKPQKNRKFSYTPRYYDERKERLEKLKKQYNDDSKANIEARIRGKISRKSARKSPGLFANANLRTFIIIGILIIIVYYFLKKYNITFE